MANMSYCRFHNTYLDLKDCVNALGEAIDSGLSLEEYLQEVGKDEAYYIKRLATYCQDFLEYHKLMEEHVTGEDY